MESILPKPGNQTKKLFSSGNHLMAITLKHHENGRISLNFYDPNTTMAHLKFRLESKEQLATMDITDFLSETRCQEYFPESHPSASFISSKTADSQKDTHVSLVSNMNNSMLFLLLDQGHFSSEFARFLYLSLIHI